MKLLLLALVICAGCTTTAKIPAVCQRNLRDCTAAYEEDKVSFCKERNGEHCSKEDWNALCNQDLNLCRGN